MKTMSQETFTEKIKLHEGWLSGEPGGERLLLSGFRLENMYAIGKNLTRCIIRKCEIINGRFETSNFAAAQLYYSSFINTDMSRACLESANFNFARLDDVTFAMSNLQETEFFKTSFKSVNFAGADLRGADLDFANWPLWRGTKEVKVDRRLFLQLLAHLCTLEVSDEDCKEFQKHAINLASKSHIANCLFEKKPKPKESNNEKPRSIN